jgi:hypothetical protein
MPNFTISSLPPAILPIDTVNTFFELQTFEAGIAVSRKIAAANLGIGGGVLSVVGGLNINVDATDVQNPIVNLPAAISGVDVNSVTLSTAGPATEYLDHTGNYSVPAGSLPAPVTAFNTLRVNAGATAWEEDSTFQIDATQIIVEGVNLRVRTGGQFVLNTDDNVASALLISGPPTTGGETTLAFTGNATFLTGGATRYQISDVNQRHVFLDFPLFIEERAAAGANVAAFGQVYVRNDAPNNLRFNDDAGNDFGVGYANARETSNATHSFNTAGNLAENAVLFYDDGNPYTVTLEDSGSVVNWPLRTAIQVLAPTVGAITIAEGAGTTLFEADGTDTVGGGTLTQGVVTIYRTSATDYYIWGSGFTP